MQTPPIWHTGQAKTNKPKYMEWSQWSREFINTHFIDILLLDVGVQKNTWLSKTWYVITVLEEKSTLGYIKD